MHTATGMDLSVRMGKRQEGHVPKSIGPAAEMAESQIWETNLTVMLVLSGPNCQQICNAYDINRLFFLIQWSQTESSDYLVVALSFP